MADSNRSATARTGIKCERWDDCGTVSYWGTREALIDAGVLREEWIPVNKKSKNASVRTLLPDGTSVSVYKRGARLEVRHELAKEDREKLMERAFRELEARRSMTRKDAPSRIHDHASLQRTVGALRAAYPGVSIINATYGRTNNGTFQQLVCFSAPLDRLVECGLVTQAMISTAENWRRSDFLTQGDGWSIFSASDDKSNPGNYQLFLFTGAAPREPDRFSVREAQRELKRIMKRATPQSR